MSAAREPAVLLISPGILKWTDADFGLPHLVSLGGYLEQHTRVRVEILDLNYEAGDHRALQRTLEELGPYRLIGVSCYSSFDYLRVMALARWLKALYPGVPLVAGGYHPTAVPDDLVFEGSPFDAVVCGEGERALRAIVEQGITRPVYRCEVIEDLDELPPYRWDLLRRYWPRARSIGSKLQLYLGRGCPYHCTFCMERAKGAYRWRAFSPARAIDELKRLAAVTKLSDWVVNLADPLFGFERGWRREVLTGIVREGLVPRQFWTLTRTDDLEEEDVALLARARFAIGVGLESGSPEMLQRMHKAANPGQYLERTERFAGLALEHRLTWSANLVVGHPGETPATLAETHAFCTRLFTGQPRTSGWLSVDPFRLYPGSQVHEHLAEYEAECGARFPYPAWWRHWTDAALRAESLDPSRELDFEGRVRAMYEAYGPLVREIAGRFQGQGRRDADAIFERSQLEQVQMLSPEVREALLGRKPAQTTAESLVQVRIPVGLHVKDERVRRREQAVLQLVDLGVLQTERLVTAMLEVDCHELPLPLYVYAQALEALGPAPGESAVALLGSEGYVAQVLKVLVGPTGSVRRRRSGRPADVIWLGAAMPRLPAELARLVKEGGRCVAILGPRFRLQDLVCLTRVEGRLREQVLGRVEAPLLAGRWGWTP